MYTSYLPNDGFLSKTNPKQPLYIRIRLHSPTHQTSLEQEQHNGIIIMDNFIHLPMTTMISLLHEIYGAINNQSSQTEDIGSVKKT